MVAGQKVKAVALLAALLACASGCPKTPAPQAVAVAPPPAVAAVAEPPAQPAAAPEEAPSAEEPMWQRKPADKPAGSPYGDNYTANKTHHEGDSYNDEIRERSLRSLRPKPKRERASLDGTMLRLEFARAELNETPGAHLHDLHFRLSDGEHEATAVMTDKQREVALTLNLGWGGLKVKPLVSDGEILPIGMGTVRNRVERYGNYELVLLDGAGRPLATAQITPDRRLVAGSGRAGYAVWMRRDPEWEDQQILHVARAEGDKPTRKLLLMRWHDESAQIHELRDKVGNEFEYKFPVGRFELIKPPAED